MPANYLATIRYNIIDTCLRDKSRVWRWGDLADIIYHELKEEAIMNQPPCRRTVMADIAAMRSGVLGYHAPIVYDRTRGYEYMVDKFSIHNVNLSPQLIHDLEETLSLLTQWTHQARIDTLTSTLRKLSERLKLTLEPNYQPIIYLEQSTNELGLRWLDLLYTHIRKQQTLQVRYLPFGEKSKIHYLAPAFLKEYNNRWYLYGYQLDDLRIVNLSLDRVEEISPSLRPYQLPEGFGHDRWFEDLYGVTKPTGATPIEIVFTASQTLCNYLDTKAIHTSQSKVITDGIPTYTIRVYDNYEIRSRMRSYGEDIQVLKPSAWL